MAPEPSVLVIGLDPNLIDFSQPQYADTGMNAEKILAGAKASEDELTRLGYSVQTCLTDFGETAEAVVQKTLEQKRFDCVNVVHAHAPQAKICFNTNPGDTAAAVQRWL